MSFHGTAGQQIYYMIYIYIHDMFVHFGLTIEAILIGAF